MDQHETAKRIVSLARDDHDLDEFDALALLDYMAMIGVQFVEGTAASDAYQARVTRQAGS